jgi:hypothetical protein
MTSITQISATNFSSFLGGKDYQNMKGITSSENGQIIYVCMYDVLNIGVVKSINNGTTWTIVNSSSGFTSIACSSDGQIVYLVRLGQGLYKSTDAGNTWNSVIFLNSVTGNPDNTFPGGSTNPEISDTVNFGGYNLTNIYQIACDSTGDKLIMTTNAAAAIYQSLDGGSTWSFIYGVSGYIVNNSTTYITCNTDGSILYAALNNTPELNIIVSKDFGLSWTSMNMLGLIGPFASLSTNSYGDFVYAINNGLNVLYPTHTDKSLVPLNGSTFVTLTNYNDGNNLIISQNLGQDGYVSLYSITNKYSPGQLNSTYIACFKEDSKILCFKEGREMYVKVQDIRKGYLVKTLEHGYIPVDMIGKRNFHHDGLKERITSQLYKCSKTEYPELLEDLIITGCHSILVDSFKSNEQKEKVFEVLGDIYVTDNKLRVPACVDDRAFVYEKPGNYTIYHLALENDDYYMNYGIYANGLLVETCSKRFLKEYSSMTLIE